MEKEGPIDATRASYVVLQFWLLSSRPRLNYE